MLLLETALLPEASLLRLLLEAGRLAVLYARLLLPERALRPESQTSRLWL